MQVSKGDLIAAEAGLNWIRAQIKQTENSFKISRQLRVFEPAIKELDEGRNEIRREYTLMDEETGQPVTSVTPGGQVGTRLSDTFAYEGAMDDLTKEEVEIPVTPITKSDFGKIFKKIESGHLMALVDIGFVQDPELKPETEAKPDDEEDEEDTEE